MDASTSDRARRHTGALSLIVTGVPPTPSSAESILGLVQRTEFVEDSVYSEEYEGGSIRYAAAPLVDNSLGDAFFDGRILYRFVIEGTPPTGYRALDAGTYYLFVNFVEGPDWDEGRWVGRVIDDEGVERGMVLGIEVKRVIAYGVDEEEHAEHRKPGIHGHGLEGDQYARRLGAFDLPGSTSSWIVTSGDWTPHGRGCERTFYCTPTIVAAYQR